MTTDETRAIALVFSRPSDFGREQEWSDWYDDVHLPATVAASQARVVTRWETIDRPPGFSTPVGFTHVAIYEFAAAGQIASLYEVLDGPRTAGGPIHPMHTVLEVDAFIPFGRWTKRVEPSPQLRGQVLAYVAPNDPQRLAEWNAWYDDVHAPDMMDSGAFSNTTRWERLERRRWSPNYLTLYDVTESTVPDAVAMSGAAMGPAKANGRLLDYHAGGLRSALTPAGRFGGEGYRP